MKTSDILRSFLVASALTGIAARAADPQPAPAARQPLSTSLKTGSLSTGGLATSGGLDGHGAGVIVRLTEEAWRLLFPLKQPGN